MLISSVVAGMQGSNPNATASHNLAAGPNQAGQGSGNKFIKVSSVCKHFSAYSLEAADGTMRFWFDAKVKQI